ncbi:MAG: DMT family transporter [Pseudomonadota bacterium]|nr:DMT family transporter [Pseudomonadota bacterium]
MQREKNTEFGITIVVLSSLCFAVVPTAAKTAMESGASLFVLLFSRCLIGLFLLTPNLIFQKKNSLFLPKKFILPTLFSSLISVSLIATTYHAIEFLDIAIVLIIMYSFPVGIAIITYIRGEDKTSLSQWMCLLVVMFGLIIIVSDGTFQGNVYGLTVSIISLTLMTSFIYYSGKLVVHLGSQKFNFHMNFWSLLILLFTYLWFDFRIEVPDTTEGKIALFFNGVFYILSYTLFFVGSKQIGITRASVLACTEPLFATLLALVFLNQFLTIMECLGFLVVIVSLCLYEKYKV